MKTSKLKAEHFRRKAVIYIRQSTVHQVTENLESQRRQYALKDYAQELGFSSAIVIDEDLGRSGSGKVDRPGFERLFAELASHEVGAVFCLEASRLARNGRDWHTLLDVCALVDAVIVDPEGVYDPKDGNDRLLLGLKGSLSEYELTLLRQRAMMAIRQKAERGEHRFCLPVGLSWTEGNRIVLNPDRRVQNAIRQVYAKYAELGSIRQVLLWFRHESMELPIRPNGSLHKVNWAPAVYSTIQRTLNSPLYAGAYVWGRTKAKTNKSGSNTWERKPMERWRVLIVDHHPGYITWEEYLRLQRQLSEHTFMNKFGRKAGRGGTALLVGMLRCRRCGRRMRTTYNGSGRSVPCYTCPGQSRQGGARCISFSGFKVDEAISSEILQAVQQPAIEAALETFKRIQQRQKDCIHNLELEHEQVLYQAKWAGQRYESVDPDNHLVAPELAKRWNIALEKVKEVERRLDEQRLKFRQEAKVDRETLLQLAKDLPSLWHEEKTSMRTKQRIVRILIKEVLADVDLEKGKVNMLIHWNGGRHSEVQAKRRRPGQHRLTTSMESLDIIRRMLPYWDEKCIASTLNRLGQKTATGKTWTASRVRSIRYLHGLTDTVVAAEANSMPAVTLKEAAERLKTNTMAVRKLIKDKILPAEQIVPFAPWRIMVKDLENPAVAQALGARPSIKPPRHKTEGLQTSMFTGQ